MEEENGGVNISDEVASSTELNHLDSEEHHWLMKLVVKWMKLGVVWNKRMKGIKMNM